MEDIDHCLQQESSAPLNPHRCDIPSTRFQDLSEDSSAPGLELEGEGEGFPRIEYFAGHADRLLTT